ncbi:MAG: hypothetical protein E7458_03940 [Ruminococcaceae bacterium]|nr:hypothetical protein [Oscillospiraceae bacterium]
MRQRSAVREELSLLRRQIVEARCAAESCRHPLQLEAALHEARALEARRAYLLELARAADGENLPPHP